MLLIETTHDESDEDLREAIDQMLARVWDPPQFGWWHAYTLGRMFEYESGHFREFVCPAGSVTGHLLVRASKSELQRALIATGVDRNGTPTAQIVIKHQSTALDAAKLRNCPSDST